MQQFLDFLPVALFGAAYFVTGDIYQATVVLMVATTLQVAITWFTKRHVSGQLWLVLGISLVFGGLTLLLHDKQFLYWKPTILNWLFAAIIGGGIMVGRNPLQTMLGAQLALPAPAWRTLGIGWAIGFFLEGALNIVVFTQFSEAFWVGYKLWGGIAITALFIGLTIAYLARAGYLNEPDEPTLSAAEPVTAPGASDANGGLPGNKRDG